MKVVVDENVSGNRDELRILSTDASEMVLPVAGLGSRSYAFLIDWHIRFLLAAAWVAAVAASVYLIQQTNVFDAAFSGDSMLLFIVMLPAIAVFFLYHPVLETVMHGSTPGKRMVGVRLVTNRGETPGFGAILVRNVFRLIDALPSVYLVGIGVVLCTRYHVRIGDLAAGTVLVHDERVSAGTFDTLASHVSSGSDLHVVELAGDLLDRWSGLAPDRRRSLALKVLQSQGIAPPAELTGKQLERWLEEQLRELCGGAGRS